MSYANRVEFFEEYKKLCDKYKLYIDTGFRQPLYIQKQLYPVDESMEATFVKLQEDIG